MSNTNNPEIKFTYPELKPCPFCGGKNMKFGSRHCSFGTDIYIKCTCGAKIQICEEFGEAKLKALWNQRADNA